MCLPNLFLSILQQHSTYLDSNTLESAELLCTLCFFGFPQFRFGILKLMLKALPRVTSRRSCSFCFRIYTVYNKTKRNTLYYNTTRAAIYICAIFSYHLCRITSHISIQSCPRRFFDFRLGAFLGNITHTRTGIV